MNYPGSPGKTMGGALAAACTGRNQTIGGHKCLGSVPVRWKGTYWWWWWAGRRRKTASSVWRFGINFISTEIARGRRKRHTSDLWNVIPRIFDLDTLRVERIHKHILAVVKLICHMLWSLVIVQYCVFRLGCFLAVLFSYKSIWTGIVFSFKKTRCQSRSSRGLINKVKR